MKHLVIGLFVCFVLHAATRYESIVSRMQSIQKNNPNTVAITSIGINNSGDNIYAFRISSSPQIMDAYKTGFVLVGTHHGNEGQTAEIVLKYADRVAKYVSRTNYELYLIPVLNIPGYNRNTRLENGIDPNRDYTTPCKTDKAFKLNSTKSLDNLLSSRLFSASVTLHGFIGVIVYPWGLDTDDLETYDQAYYTEITKLTASKTNYRYGNSTALIYGANGCYEDYAYWKFGIWSLLFEIYNGSASDVDMNVNAIEAFFNNVDDMPSQNHGFTGSCNRSLIDRKLD